MALLAAACTEAWSCGEWSACVNGMQSRTCADVNRCNMTLFKPESTKACQMPAVEQAPAPAPAPVKSVISWIIILSILGVIISASGITSGLIVGKKKKSSKEFGQLIARAHDALGKGDKESAKNDYLVLQEVFKKSGGKLLKKDAGKIYDSGTKLYRELVKK